MFKNNRIDSCLGEKIYEFSDRKIYEYSVGNTKRTLVSIKEPTYLKQLDYIDQLFKDVKNKFDHSPLFTVDYDFWWLMNESYPAYSEPNTELPILWLAIAKWALKIDYMPSNFYAWALPILEWFDLERWAKAYHPQEIEYNAIKRDLVVVLEKLRNYPKDKLAPPVDEENWGAET